MKLILWHAVEAAELLAAEQIDGPLLRGPVNAHVGGVLQPVQHLSIEIVHRIEGSSFEEVVLEIFDGSLDLALGPSPIRPAGLRAEAIVLGQSLKARVETHAARAVLESERRMLAQRGGCEDGAARAAFALGPDAAGHSRQ